jgi:hypothetical protein
MSVPYASAATGTKAREEITKILRRFGCEEIGFMDNFNEHTVLLAFTHRGRRVQLNASAKGWAQMWLRENPWSSRCRRSRIDHEQDALKQGHVAVNSVLRDWIKGQLTAVECGILSFEAVFMPFMLTSDGRPLHERAAELPLPAPQPEQQKVVALPRP